VGISVSRVGGAAQVKGMKQVAGTLRLDLAQYREMAAFAQFASDLDPATQRQLNRGVRLVELLKQGQYQPLSVGRQVIVVYAGTKGLVDQFPVGALGEWEKGLLGFMEAKHPKIIETLDSGAKIDDALEKELRASIEEYNAGYRATLDTQKV
jgi:F-type H+-transporting ATPase subunit alpha